MSAKDFLVELGTQELPPKALSALSAAFSQGIIDGLKQAGIAFTASKSLASPRRLALVLSKLEERQADQNIERRGPAVKAAFDAEGNPSKAAEGFARSCGVSVAELERVSEGKGEWLAFRSVKAGETTAALIPQIIEKSLAALPIPKRMRWGSSRIEFVRPVRWLSVVHGDQVIDCEILAKKSSNQSFGHRFHAPEAFTITSPASYQEQLRSVKVIADFAERRALIVEQVNAAAKAVNGQAVIDENLLDEVTGLVEWPVALCGRFDTAFLEVPAESLISSMAEHQKYFHLVDAKGELMAHFITVSNIESKDPRQVIEGNEKVIRPRLADAKFFFDTDRKTTLESKTERLKPVVFQADLGSIFDKSDRISVLAEQIATTIGSDAANAKRAALISKADLSSEMVLEFPDLQGIMGQYYARFDGENEEVAQAQNEQYMPRFAGDALPSSLTGCCVSLADKIDTLVGIFGIGQEPSGNRDPFALRRATLGVLRIMVEKELPLDLRVVLRSSIEAYAAKGIALPLAKAKKVVDKTVDGLIEHILNFMLERFRARYQDQQIPVEVFLAVRALTPSSPADFDKRVQAVNNFRQLSDAEALAAANKRVANILAKSAAADIASTVDSALLSDAAEQALFAAVEERQSAISPLLESGQYTEVLEALASLRAPVDKFFDEVFVNADDMAVRSNRYALLQQLRMLFLEVADISLLQA